MAATIETIPAPASPFAGVPPGVRLPQLVAAPGPEHIQAVCGDLTAAVVGVGSVGWSTALHLSRLHVSVLLVDGGRIKPASLVTHPAFPEDLGRSKAANLGRLCKRLSPQSTVRVFDGPVKDLPLEGLARCGLVVLATDNLQAEVETGRRCRLLGAPLVQASLHGQTLMAQVRFFSNRSTGPCPACDFSAMEWRALNRQVRFSCEGGGSRIDGPATMSLSFLCATAADLAMVQIFRHLFNLGPPVADTILEYCGYTHKTGIRPLVQNPDCPVDHTVPTRVAQERPATDLTLADLAAAATGTSQPEVSAVSVRFGGYAFVEKAACACSRLRTVRRFAAKGEGGTPCGRCRSPLTPHPYYTLDPLPLDRVPDEMTTPLGRLGIRAAAWAEVRHGKGSTLFFFPASSEEACDGHPEERPLRERTETVPDPVPTVLLG